MVWLFLSSPLKKWRLCLNLIMAEIAKRGYKDITLVASSIFPCHKPVVEYMEKGIVTQIYAGYMSGPVAQAISEGKLQNLQLCTLMVEELE